MRPKLQQTNIKYNNVDDKHLQANMFKDSDKMIAF